MIRGTTPTLEFGVMGSYEAASSGGSSENNCEAYLVDVLNPTVSFKKHQALSKPTVMLTLLLNSRGVLKRQQSMLLMAQIIINQLLTDHQQQRILRLVFLTEN